MRKLFLLAIVSAPVWACTCGRSPSAKDAWRDSPLVFVGSIDRTDPKIIGDHLMSGVQTTWVRVTEPFKGVTEGQVLELRDQFSSCFGGFREGTTLLFYLHPGEKKGTWTAPACHRTRRIQDAADDLKFLRALPASAEGNRVSGVVILWEDEPSDGPTKSRKLGGVGVHALGAAGAYETTTDAEGLYEFRNLPPDAYTIKVDYPAGTILRFPMAFGNTGSQRRPEGTQLEVTADSANGFDYILAPDTRISGRVLDPNGRPMKGVCLQIDPLQNSSPKPFRTSGCTQADGSYQLAMMPAGTYRIVANRGGRMTVSEPFGQLYYPGTPDVAKAAVLTVAAGRPLDGIDLHVPELARRIELRGRLTFSNGVPVAGQTLKFRAKDADAQYARTDAAGNFVMQILGGQPGQITGEIGVARGLERDCPQFEAKFSPNEYGVYLHSIPYPVAGDAGISGIELVFPFPSCDAWLKRQPENR